MTSQEEPERLDAVVMEPDGSLERAPTSQEEPMSLAAVVVEPGAEQEVVVSQEECESVETVLVSQEKTTVVSIKCVAADVP